MRNAFYEKARYEIENNVTVSVDSTSLSREGRMSARKEDNDPKYIKLLRMLGTIYERNGRSEMALKYVQRAKALAKQAQ